MIVLVLSDLHFGNQVNTQKQRALKKLIMLADKVIINGDFWDRYLTTFDQFVNSDWAKLFLLLKQKKTVYLFGNHDPQKLIDKRVSWFCVQTGFEYDLDISGQKYHIEHGDRLKPACWLLDFLADLSFSISGVYWSTKIFVFCQTLFVKVFGIKLYQKIHNGENLRVLRAWQKKCLNKNYWLVCGHTHSAVFDKKEKYINTGFCRFGYLQYLTINNQKLSLKTIRY